MLGLNFQVSTKLSLWALWSCGWRTLMDSLLSFRLHNYLCLNGQSGWLLKTKVIICAANFKVFIKSRAVRIYRSYIYIYINSNLSGSFKSVFAKQISSPLWPFWSIFKNRLRESESSVNPDTEFIVDWRGLKWFIKPNITEGEGGKDRTLRPIG